MKPKKLSKADKKAEQLRIDSIRAKFLEPDTEEDEIKYQTIIDYCKQFDTVFHDGEFPHTAENFGKRILKSRKRNLKIALKRLKVGEILKSRKLDYILVNFTTSPHNWMRPVCSKKDFEWCFWKPGLHYEIEQMGIGNCGFVAALSAISPHEKLLKSIFRNMELSEYGVYQVKLCVDGEWKIIVVDDWTPHIVGMSRSVECHSSNPICYQLWPTVLEKAVAKVSGGYDGIKGFSPDKALLMFTGAPIIRCFLKNIEGEKEKDDFWNFLKQSKSKEFIMTSYTRKKADRKPPVNLRNVHGHTIIEVIEIHSYRLLRLRDPNAITRWDGKWSSSWDGWSKVPHMKLLLHRKVISGSFWIEFDDFMKYFHHANICRWRDSWNEIRVNMAIGGLWDDSQKVILITVSKACEASVSVHKPKENVSMLNCTCISIHEIDSNDPEEIGEIVMCGPIEFSSNDVKLQAGQYMITVSNFHKSPLKEERNVCIHSSVPLCAKLCSWSPKKLVGVFQKGISKTGKEIVNDRNDISIKKFYDDEDTFMIVMADNYSYDKYLHVHCYCSNMDNCTSSRSVRPEYNIGDVIPPRSSQILVFLYRYPWTKRKKFSVRIEYYLSNERMTKIGRSEGAAHIPSIGATDYIHHTVYLE